MIFDDGEFRHVRSSKPLLFDGWGYVMMEPKSSAVEVEIVRDIAPRSQEISFADDLTLEINKGHNL